MCWLLELGGRVLRDPHVFAKNYLHPSSFIALLKDPGKDLLETGSQHLC